MSWQQCSRQRVSWHLYWDTSIHHRDTNFHPQDTNFHPQDTHCASRNAVFFTIYYLQSFFSIFHTLKLWIYTIKSTNYLFTHQIKNIIQLKKHPRQTHFFQKSRNTYLIFNISKSKMQEQKISKKREQRRHTSFHNFDLCI